MTSAFLVSALLLGAPIVILGAALGKFVGDDGAARALGIPASAAIAVFACSLVSAFDIGGTALELTPAALGLVGLALLVREHRLAIVASQLAWPIAAAGATLLICFLPFHFAHGQGVLGYDIANDSALHAVIIDHLVHPNRALADGSTADAVVKGVEGNGYPLGSHELIAVVAAALGGVLRAYDAALAVLVALIAFPAYWLSRRIGSPAALSALAAVGAAGGYLQLQYYQQGFAPQMAATALIIGVIGLAYEAVSRRSIAAAALAGVTLGGAFVVYALTIAIYVGGALGVLAVWLLVSQRDAIRHAAMQLAFFAVGALIAVAPVLGSSIDFARAASSTVQQQSGAVAAGNLSAPADAKLALGAWIGPDFRVPYIRTKRTRAGMAAAALLAAIGLLWTLRRRRWALAVTLGSTAFAALVVSQRSGIYYTAKTYEVLAVPTACAIAAGGWALASTGRGWMRWPLSAAGVVLLAGYALVAGESISASVHNGVLTPPDVAQMSKLREPGLGLALVPDDWAKYALPNASVPLDRATSSALSALRPGAATVGWIDSDSLPESSLDRARWIVEYRMGGTSVPPPPFYLARQTASFRLWARRSGAPGVTDLRPLEAPSTLGGLMLAPGASYRLPALGASRIALQVEPAGSYFWNPASWHTSGTGWGPWVADPAYVVAQGPGTPLGHGFTVASTGDYRLLMIGLASPAMRIRIDGKAFAPRVLSIDARQLVATVRLSAGTHTVELDHGAGPGVSYVRAISLDPNGSTSTVAVCLNGTRRRASGARPLIAVGREHSVVTACGAAPVDLDWVARASTAKS